METLETRKGLIPKEKAGSDVTILKYRKRGQWLNIDHIIVTGTTKGLCPPAASQPHFSNNNDDDDDAMIYEEDLLLLCCIINDTRLRGGTIDVGMGHQPEKKMGHTKVDEDAKKMGLGN